VSGATIEIVAAPPYLTIQDQGRPGHRADGVPGGGAMDTWGHAVANVVVGNPANSAALEWGLSGGRIRWQQGGVFALAGAGVEATLDGEPVAMHRSQRAETGSELVITRFLGGRFVYIAFSGGIDVPLVLGSRSTYLAARFGGLEGRMVRAGDRLAMGGPGDLAVAGFAVPGFAVPGFAVPADLVPRYDRVDAGVVTGPDARLFSVETWRVLTDTAFGIDAASDRMGYRLVGPPIEHAGDAALPSAPVCAGAVQIPAGGRPIVLMADGPTVGGYPVIAVVCSADLPVVAQRRPGESVRFRAMTVEESQRAFRRRAVAIHTLAHLARPELR
jgi:antagonist of KipI